jgi:origin recognition complex subunit 1
LTTSFDVNPLASINGKATVTSLPAFQKAYPQHKIPKNSKDFGKLFVCRRGCNTRTTTYTEEFSWENIYHGAENIQTLIELVKTGTKETRRRRKVQRAESPDALFDDLGEEDTAWKAARKVTTPKKPRSQPGTPKKPKTPTSQRK